MNTKQKSIIIISLLILACSFRKIETIRVEINISNTDSLILENYKFEIKKGYIEGSDGMTKDEVDSIFSELPANFADSKVAYSPDKSFKIFTIEVEECGAYCNSEWYSWIHFNLNSNETVVKVEFKTIDTIFKLPDNKYLIIDKSWDRPASVMTESCINANVISFSSNSLIIHPIKYQLSEYFGFCQENGVETETAPYIKYNEDKKKLFYYYGNNYGYPNGPDIDTIRQGYFKYIKGQFIAGKETILVIDKRELNEK